MPVKRTYKAVFQGPSKRRFGKIDRTAKKYHHGDTAGYDRYNFVGAAVVRTGRASSKRVEKRFFRELKDPQRDFRILNELREAGVKVVPDYQLVLTKNDQGKLERSLVMADLTERGKKIVIPGNRFAGNKESFQRIKNLKNFNALMRQKNKETVIAERLGYDLGYDAWLFVIDPRNNRGKIFVTDVDSLWRTRRPHHDSGVFGLKRAGVLPSEMRSTVRVVDSIVRRSIHPVKSSIQQLARINLRLKQPIVSTIQSIIRRDPRFREITGLFQFMASVALMPQIGGAATRGSSMGMNKDERRKLNEFIAELAKNGYFKTHRSAKVGPHKLAIWFHDSVYRTDWDSKARFIPTIKGESRSSQWDRNRMGSYAAGQIASASKRLGSFVFKSDKSKLDEWARVAKELESAKSERAAVEIVKKDRKVIMNHLVAELYLQFQRDISQLARLRIRRDLKPYQDPRVIEMIEKEREASRKRLGLPPAVKPLYKEFM